MEIYSEDSILQMIEKLDYPDSVKIKARELKRLLAITDVVVGCLPVYLVVLREYQRERAQGKIPLMLPLSFKSLSEKKEIIALCGKSPIVDRFNILDFIELKVDDKGVASFTLKVAPEVSEEIPQGWTPGYTASQHKDEEKEKEKPKDVKAGQQDDDKKGKSKLKTSVLN